MLVQGAGVAESAPNPDSSRSDPNRDFIAQGAGNIAASLFQGQPVGGSVGQTALNVSAGARNRWAAIFSGIWMAVILVAFSGAVGEVVLSCLAGLLIYAAVSSIRFGQIKVVAQSGPNSIVAMVATFVATLLMPIAAAVGVGVVVSLLLQLNQGLVDLRVIELRRRDDGAFEEHPAPTVTPSRQVLVLDAYGSLLYAGARTLQSKLPDPAGSTQPVVVLRLRGRTSLGATFAAVIADYVGRLDNVDGHLILSGVQSPMLAKVERTVTTPAGGRIEVYEATNVLGESTNLAIDAGLQWLADHQPVSSGPSGRDGRRGGENDDGATPDEPSDVTPRDVSRVVSSADDLGLGGGVLGVVEFAAGVEVGELGELLGVARAAGRGRGLDVLLHLLVLLLGGSDLPLTHPATADDEVDEDAEERDEDDEDRPDGLGPPAHVVAADDVAEDREDQHDPHEEEEEPEDGPEDLAGSPFCCE